MRLATFETSEDRIAIPPDKFYLRRQDKNIVLINTSGDHNLPYYIIKDISFEEAYIEMNNALCEDIALIDILARLESILAHH